MAISWLPARAVGVFGDLQPIYVLWCCELTKGVSFCRNIYATTTTASHKTLTLVMYAEVTPNNVYLIYVLAHVLGLHDDYKKDTTNLIVELF